MWANRVWGVQVIPHARSTPCIVSRVEEVSTVDPEGQHVEQALLTSLESDLTARMRLTRPPIR